MVDDIDAEKGLLITEMGYTKSALKRAYYNPKHIELDVLSLKELKSDLHGEIAIPYSGENGILIFAPLGWIVDAHKRQGAICLLYQRGLTLEEAGINKELAYINFWNKSISDFDLQGLLDHQENYMRKERNVKSINYQKSIERDDSETIIRVADIENYPGLEVTGFIEFKDFIVFIVWFCVETSLKRTISKMQLLIKSILPIKIKFE